MSTSLRFRRLLPVVLILLPCLAVASAKTEHGSATEMAEAAHALIDLFSADQRDAAMFPFEADSLRTDWSNLPASIVARRGARVGDFSDDQRRAFHRLLRASTSSQGYQKLAGVIRLDEILHHEASAAVAAGERQLPPDLVESWTADNYWVSFFGNPGDASWGWQLSGHHLAANFTVVDGRLSFTPLFLGAEPNEIMQGMEAGWRALSHEGDRGLELAATLTDDQRSLAVLSPDVPRDVLEGPGRKGALTEFAGIPANQLSDEQRILLWSLIDEYVSNADHDAAAAQLALIQQDGLDRLFFGWMGPLDDETARFYYRVHSPSILIEFVVEEGVGGAAANHVHSIVRDPRNDYGADWLGRHYAEHH